MSVNKIIDIIKKLENRISDCSYRGYDPFDGLNSPLSNFTNNYLIKLAWIQFFKRSPLNFRRLFFIKSDYNCKGLALIIQSYCILYKILQEERYLNKAYAVAHKLIQLKSQDRPYYCWGYNFPWMARAFYVPRNEPNMIVSSFVAQSFLDLYVLDKNTKWLRVAKDVVAFIQNELIIKSSEDELCFGYIPGENVIVHNANLMGARLFARLTSITGNNDLKNMAIRSVNYSVNRQRNDGAWVYGELDHHQWIDNFHTGFNLISIIDIQKYIKSSIWQTNIEKGFSYHIDNHFLSDMTPKYFNNRIYPIDIHNYAQGIITFSALGMMEEAEKLLTLCISRMWNDKLGLFYYQQTRFYKNKINYLRWSQAWMFYAIAFYLFSSKVRLYDSL